MSLKNRITDDMKSAMRARETAKLGAIRLLLAAIKQKEVDERIVLDDANILTIIDKMLKQRRDSMTQYTAAGRTDLVAAEAFEAEVLKTYCPAGFSALEIDAVIAAAIAESGAAMPSDMGKVMALLKPKLAGRADMSEVSQKIKTALAL